MLTHIRNKVFVLISLLRTLGRGRDLVQGNRHNSEPQDGVEGHRIVTDGGMRRMERETKALHLISQPTRAIIIQNILGHPCMMPSLKELDHYNPDKTMGTISGHVDKLVDAGIVRRVTVPQSYRQKNLPETFFILSDGGYDLLENHSLFLPEKEEIKQDHARVEKPDRIKEAERAPRPTVDVEYEHPLKGDGRTVVEPADDSDDACDNWEVADTDQDELLV